MTNARASEHLPRSAPGLRTGPIGANGREKLALGAGDLLWLTQRQKKPDKNAEQAEH